MLAVLRTDMSRNHQLEGMQNSRSVPISVKLIKVLHLDCHSNSIVKIQFIPGAELAQV